jgi:hypothetical protein
LGCLETRDKKKGSREDNSPGEGVWTETKLAPARSRGVGVGRAGLCQ